MSKEGDYLKPQIDQDLPGHFGAEMTNEHVANILTGPDGASRPGDLAFYRGDNPRAHALEQDAIAEQERHKAVIAQAELAQRLLTEYVTKIDDLTSQIRDLKGKKRRGNSYEVVQHNQGFQQQIEALEGKRSDYRQQRITATHQLRKLTGR